MSSSLTSSTPKAPKRREPFVRQFLTLRDQGLHDLCTWPAIIATLGLQSSDSALQWPLPGTGRVFGEGQKGTLGRGRDRKCHDRASLSRPLVLSLGPLTSLTSFPLFCTSEDINGRCQGGASDKMGLEGKGTDLS